MMIDEPAPVPPHVLAARDLEELKNKEARNTERDEKGKSKPFVPPIIPTGIIK